VIVEDIKDITDHKFGVETLRKSEEIDQVILNLVVNASGAV